MAEDDVDGKRQRSSHEGVLSMADRVDCTYLLGDNSSRSHWLQFEVGSGPSGILAHSNK